VNAPRPADFDLLASTYGYLVAVGAIEREDGWTGMSRLVAARGYPDALKVGHPLSIACGYEVTQAALRWEMARSKAERAIRKGIGGLIMEWAEPEAIIQRAREENEAHGAMTRHGPRAPLLGHEVRAIINEEIAWWLRRQPTKRRRNAR
jgi:hypothetical protein